MTEHEKQALATALYPLLARGRTDARGTKSKTGKPFKEDKPLDMAALLHHVNGGPPYGVYPIKPGEKVCMLACLDLDNHRGKSTPEEMADAAFKISAEARTRGLDPHTWRSGGGKGIHIYFVWRDPQDARSVRLLLKDILKSCGYADGAGGVADHEVEVFPKQDRVALGAYGNYFFIPGAGQSDPLDDLTLEGLGKSAIVGYSWRNSAPVPVAPESTNPVRNYAIEADLDVVASAVASIPNDATVTYDKWFSVVSAIHSCDPGEDGHEIAEAWSEQSPTHTRAWFEHTWANLKADRASGATIASIFYRARQNGWADPRIAAAIAALEAIDIDEALAQIPISAPMPTLVDLPFFICDRKTGIAKPLISNVKLALENPHTAGGIGLGYDEFRDEIMIAERPGQWRPLGDVDAVRLRIRFETMQGGIQGIGKDMMRDAISEVADANKFDSAKMWLESLVWDGKPRISTFFATYFSAANTDYAAACSKYFWSAQAGRVLVPGIQADMTVILTGGQGRRKSTGLQALVPSQEYFVEINLAQKEDDLARLLRGKLVVEWGDGDD